MENDKTEEEDKETTYLITDRKTDIQKDRHTDRQKDRHTEKQKG